MSWISHLLDLIAAVVTRAKKTPPKTPREDRQKEIEDRYRSQR